MIDMNKEYVTKGEGLPVRIYCTDAGGDFPVHGAILRGGEWLVMYWTACGSFYAEMSTLSLRVTSSKSRRPSRGG